MNMKRKIILSTLMLILYLKVFPQFTFQRWYDNLGTDKGMAVLQTFDGGYAVLCQTQGSSAWFNTIIKTDSAGNVLWTKKLPTQYNVSANSFCQTSDSGFALAG